MTDKITRLQELSDKAQVTSWGDVPIKDTDTVYNELPALLSLVKAQHEALMTIKWEVLARDLEEVANKAVEDVAKDMWLSLDARETAEQAIAAYDAWKDGKDSK